MKPIYFKRHLDGKEFRVIAVKPTYLKGVSDDGESVLKKQDDSRFSKLYSK